MKLFRWAGLGLAVLSMLSAPVGAQTYPSRPVTLLVGYPAGGSVDLVARIISPRLAEKLGQAVVVENIGGAGGTIGAARAVNAAPDGHTLLVGSGSEVSIARLTNPAVKYDGTRDLAPIGLIGTAPMVLVGGPKLTQRSAAELLAYLENNPGKLSYASSGVGTPLNLAGELIKQTAKVDMVHVPYRGAAQMVSDTLAGNVDLAVLVLSSALPHIESGKLTPYGLTEARRSAAAPQIPTLAETPKLKGVDMGVWFGLLAPVKTPEPILARLQKELAAVLAEPEVVKKLGDAGVRVAPGSAADFAAFIRDETRKYEAIVRIGNIRE
jgi:tripartite-type tricarboxylate transporter receptor subunit TctC